MARHCTAFWCARVDHVGVVRTGFEHKCNYDEADAHSDDSSPCCNTSTIGFMAMKTNGQKIMVTVQTTLMGFAPYPN